MTETCPCKFPESIPVDCAVAIGRWVLAGEYTQNLPEIGRHAACILGSAASLLPDNSGHRVGGPLENLPGSAQECAEIVCSTYDTGEGKVAINPLAKYALMELLKFVTEKVAEQISKL